MYKKIMISGFLFLATSSIFAGYRATSKKLTAYEVVPYEKVIEREYNRMRGGIDKYTTIHDIMNQTLRGKSIEQKNQIIADLKSLKHAVHAALEQAKHDGKRMWYWGYIWKDNEPAIQTLAQYGYDIADKLTDFEFQSQPDYVRAFMYSSKAIGYMALGIAGLYMTQGYLSPDRYAKNQSHGLDEMLLAPLKGGVDVANFTAKTTLNGLLYVAAGIKNASEAGIDLLSSNRPEPTA